VYVLFVSFLLLVSSPADGGSAGEQPGDPPRQPGAGSDGVLYSVSGIAVDRRNNMYVTDLLDYSVKKFDGRGAYLGKVGRRGRGPAEFRTPALSLVTGNRLVVLQMEDPRVQVFDEGLGFRGEFNVKGGLPVDIAPDRPRGMAIALYSDTSYGIVLRYDRPEGGEPSRVQMEPTGRAHPLYAAARIAVCPDGLLVAGYLFMNRVELYTRNGRLLRRFSVLQMPATISAKDDRRVPEDTYIRKVLVDGAGRILLLGGNQAPHPGQDIFIYREDGSFIRTYELPFKCRVLASGGNGSIYASDAAGTRIEKFTLR
jgi:hypothetical protein